MQHAAQAEDESGAGQEGQAEHEPQAGRMVAQQRVGDEKPGMLMEMPRSGTPRIRALPSGRGNRNPANLPLMLDEPFAKVCGIRASAQSAIAAPAR